ncbi:type II toxin-antitoxin system PemK/MazF family toxin [Streptococcus agalactiae]|uniref:type II toxin-antitoxin system PemK/MazF family toxin n=1 Tax=Streptococcus agalactiae TaxID=1311 RepID=UPI002553152B|nr:type II toxin-antitoxin system PemK/MazF family toxin [Streptococcus agalactiae]MDK8747543.1 type II toxin-antitoxin system PemK/MazF family toxin [Streptococcus agalactiae]
MAITEHTKTEVENLFNDTLQILEALAVEPNSDEDENEEALKFADWIKIKAELRYGKLENTTKTLIKKEEPTFPVMFGGIYWCYLGTNIGDEINKHRPVLVIRSEPKSNVCTVVPLTTQRMNDTLWYHIDLENEDATAIVEQIKVISKNRIEKPHRVSGNIVKATDKDLIKVIKEMRRYYTTPPKWFAERYKEELK